MKTTEELNEQLTEEEVKKVSGGNEPEGSYTRMVCRHCGRLFTWVGNYSGKGPFNCSWCKYNELYGE